jgi:type IV pilus assembly protein PilO
MAKFDLKLTKEQKQYAFLACAIFIGAAYGYYRYFWVDIQQRIADAQVAIENTDRDIARARSVAARLPQVRARIQELEQKAEAAERRLPKKKELPVLIETLSGLARQYNVTILSFSPGQTVTKDYFVELQYQMSVRGSYHSIARFLTALALQERIFQSRALTLSPVSSNSPYETVTAQFTLLAFQYKG